MKDFYKNSSNIKNEVFILYMLSFEALTFFIELLRCYNRHRFGTKHRFGRKPTKRAFPQPIYKRYWLLSWCLSRW